MISVTIQLFEPEEVKKIIKLSIFYHFFSKSHYIYSDYDLKMKKIEFK